MSPLKGGKHKGRGPLPDFEHYMDWDEVRSIYIYRVTSLPSVTSLFPGCASDKHYPEMRTFLHVWFHNTLTLICLGTFPIHVHTTRLCVLIVFLVDQYEDILVFLQAATCT